MKPARENSGGSTPEPGPRKVVGRPFVKGQSGNPKGRPPGIARAARKLIGKDGKRALQLLAHIMDGKALSLDVVDRRGKVKRKPVQLPSVKERRFAAIELLNRACGKPTQPVELSGPGGGPMRTTTLDLGRLSDAQLEELDRLLSAAEVAPDAGADHEGGGAGRAGA